MLTVTTTPSTHCASVVTTASVLQRSSPYHTNGGVDGDCGKTVTILIHTQKQTQSGDGNGDSRATVIEAHTHVEDNSGGGDGGGGGAHDKRRG